MRQVVTLLLALAIAPLAAPVARAVSSPAADHSCCPGPAPETSTAPCQYLAALGCCEQVMAPQSVSPDAPAARLLAAAAEPLAPEPVLSSMLRAGLRRDEHGPPEAPFLRAIVLQL
jgi:hypothetical protein